MSYVFPTSPRTLTPWTRAGNGPHNGRVLHAGGEHVAVFNLCGDAIFAEQACNQFRDLALLVQEAVNDCITDDWLKRARAAIALAEYRKD